MNYDLAVIGAGWAGFNAALKARSGGLKVALIDKGQIGGTCLNRGCIPTKTLLQSSKLFSLTKKSKTFGIEAPAASIDFAAIQERKNKIILQLRQGMEFLLKGIDLIREEARLLPGNAIQAGAKKITAASVIIATGSRPFALPGLGFDGKRIISSDDILELSALPSSLLIVGGGVIGCEFASLFSAFGCPVTIAELTPQLLPGADKETAKKLESSLRKKGIKISLNTDAKSLDTSQFGLVLVSVGRSPVTDGLGLDDLGVKREKGLIITDRYRKTNIPGIYAAGDCASRVMLAHLAAHQGETAAGNVLDPSNPSGSLDANIPSCVFTDPEIASVGLSEEEARLKLADVETLKFDFLGSGMARIMDETEGFIKVIRDKKSDEIAGASIIGPRATELIGIFTVAVQSRLKVSQLRRAVLAHPTLSECVSSVLNKQES